VIERLVARPWIVIAALVLLAVALAGDLGAAFPSSVVLPLAEWADRFDAWVIRNRSTTPLFTGVIRPVAGLAGDAVADVAALLAVLGWPGVVVLAAGLTLASSGRRVAAVVVLALVAVGLIGVWDDAMLTVALTVVAVATCVTVGLPLGVLAGGVPRIERALRPVLDTLQIVPAYVYLIPAVLLLGIGGPSAVVVTVAFALPPLVRLTALGVRSVPRSLIDVAVSTGATRLQLLRTVLLPLAGPWIRAGINQTIMMALAMVVVASLVGAGGLGREVLRGLQTLDVGRALDAGVGIVLLAVALDRASGGDRDRARAALAGDARTVGVVVGVTVALAAIVSLLPASTFPAAGRLSLADATTSAVAWSSANLAGATAAVADVLTLGVLDPLLGLLVALPWWALVAAVSGLGWWLAGERLALLVVLAGVTIGALGLWEQTMDTVSQVLVATMLALVVALPLGVVASQSDRVARALRPVLDTLQTLPAFVYLVPTVALFGVGRVPGLIATVLYALPPAVRLTDVGIREVDTGALDAARSQGATRLQLLRTVQLPLARPTILLGVNQTTVMVLAGIVIAGLVGASGLGIETVLGVARGDLGRGIAAATAIVLLGVVLDRLTQALGVERALRRASLESERRRSLRRTA
jgi:glycine betaine/proline transport system permease protein